MPDDGTRVVYRTVISTYPGMMPDLIALGMLKQYWVVVLLGFTALASASSAVGSFSQHFADGASERRPLARVC
jgi:hypothetical protein